MPVGNDIVDLRDPETRPGALHPRFDARVFTPAERERIGPDEQGHRMRWLMWAAKESAYKAAKKLDPRTVFSPSRFEVELSAPSPKFGGIRPPIHPLRLRCAPCGVLPGTPQSRALPAGRLDGLGASSNFGDGAPRSEREGIVRFGDSIFSLLAELSDELVHVVAAPASEAMQTASGPADRSAFETGKRFWLQFETARLSSRARDALVAGLEVRQMAARALGSLLEIPRQRIELIRRGRVPRALFEGVRLPIDLSLSHHGRFGAYALVWKG